jgi:hypothetical protein
MCRLLDFFCLIPLCYYINECLRPLETSSFEDNKLLYECNVLWNRIVKGIEILVFKSFDKGYDCMKYMIAEWCERIVTHIKN